MGRKAKYEKILLIHAVDAYSMNHHGEIKLKDLAQWADENVDGLEGVRYYNFSRESEVLGKIRKLDEETRKYNELREKLTSPKNILLRGDIDSFFGLKPSEQFRMIEETRKEYGKLLGENCWLRKENKKLREELQNEVIEKNNIQRDYLSLKTDVSFLRKIYEEYEAKGKLDEIGVGEDRISLLTLNSALSEHGNCCSVDQVISRFVSEFMSDEPVQGKGFSDEGMNEAENVMLPGAPGQDDGDENE